MYLKIVIISITWSVLHLIFGLFSELQAGYFKIILLTLLIQQVKNSASISHSSLKNGRLTSL